MSPLKYNGRCSNNNISLTSQMKTRVRPERGRIERSQSTARTLKFALETKETPDEGRNMEMMVWGHTDARPPYDPVVAAAVHFLPRVKDALSTSIPSDSGLSFLFADERPVRDGFSGVVLRSRPVLVMLLCGADTAACADASERKNGCSRASFGVMRLVGSKCNSPRNKLSNDS